MQGFAIGLGSGIETNHSVHMLTCIKRLKLMYKITILVQSEYIIIQVTEQK